MQTAQDTNGALVRLNLSRTKFERCGTREGWANNLRRLMSLGEQDGVKGCGLRSDNGKHHLDDVVDCRAQFHAIEREETVHQDGCRAFVAAAPGMVCDEAKAQGRRLANEVCPFKSCGVARASQGGFDQGAIKDTEVRLLEAAHKHDEEPVHGPPGPARNITLNPDFPCLTAR